MKQIKYKTFVKRKNFSIISWIRNSKEKTYERLSAFLSSKNIIPPGKEYWEKAINFYNDSLVNEANAHDDVTDVKVTEKTSSENIDEKKMIISVMKEKIKKDTLSKTSSSKPKRRRRRKNNAENITE